MVISLCANRIQTVPTFLPSFFPYFTSSTDHQTPPALPETPLFATFYLSSFQLSVLNKYTQFCPFFCLISSSLHIGSWPLLKTPSSYKEARCFREYCTCIVNWKEGGGLNKAPRNAIVSSSLKINVMYLMVQTYTTNY